MVVRRKGGGSHGDGGGRVDGEFDLTRCGLTPPSPPCAAQIAQRQARKHTYEWREVQRDANPTRPYRQDQTPKRSSTARRSRIRQRSEISTTTAISYASDDEHEFFDDLSSCGTVSETGRCPRSVTTIADTLANARQQRVSELDASYSVEDVFAMDDDVDDMNPRTNSRDDGRGKRPRVSFYTAIYDTSRGESRAEGTSVRVQRSGKHGMSSSGGSHQSYSPPVSLVSVPTADATTVASSHVSDEEDSPRSPKSRIRDVVRRISQTASLSFFGDSHGDIDIDSEGDDELFHDNDYEAKSGSKSVERTSKIKGPKVPSSLHRIEGSLHDHGTPLGLVRIVPARESSLRCILTKSGSEGSAPTRAAVAPSPWDEPRTQGKILDAVSFRFPSLFVTMGCVFLLVSALVATSTTGISFTFLPTLSGTHHLPPSALASTYLSLMMNEVRYQAFRVASVQCRDLGAIRYDLMSAADNIRNRRLLLDLDEEEKEKEANDSGATAMSIVIEKLRREASFVSRQRVEER